jgi:hypothetical protein
MRIHTLHQFIDLAPFIPPQGVAIHCSLDAGGITTLIIAEEPAWRYPDGTICLSEPNTEPRDYLVLRHDYQGRLIFKTSLPKQTMNHFSAHLLSSGEILVVCARCAYRGPDDIDKNAKVFDLDGTFKREFTLGDGIQHLTIDASGRIWTSYFDEGVIGGNGWWVPIGRPGLVCWDAFGNQLWELEMPPERHYLIDCYAMNLDLAGNCWICYYPDFPMVRIDQDRGLTFLEQPVQGARSLHVFGDYILMGPGYEEEDFTLLKITGPTISQQGRITFQTPEGESLGARFIDYGLGQSPNIGFQYQDKIYFTEMASLGLD